MPATKMPKPSQRPQPSHNFPSKAFGRRSYRETHPATRRMCNPSTESIDLEYGTDHPKLAAVKVLDARFPDGSGGMRRLRRRRRRRSGFVEAMVCLLLLLLFLGMIAYIWLRCGGGGGGGGIGGPVVRVWGCCRREGGGGEGGEAGRYLVWGWVARESMQRGADWMQSVSAAGSWGAGFYGCDEREGGGIGLGMMG